MHIQFPKIAHHIHLQFGPNVCQIAGLHCDAFVGLMEYCVPMQTHQIYALLIDCILAYKLVNQFHYYL